MLFWVGITLITTPQRISSNSILLRALSLETHPVIAGWIFLPLSAAILFLTVDRWVKILPGFFAYSTIGGLITLLSGQHNRAPAPWQAALFLTIFGISASALSLTFQGRKLRLIDRIALMGFQACLPLGATTKLSVMYGALTASLAFLLIAWQLEVISRRKSNETIPRIRSTV
jgi:hypothetical protein